MIISVSIMFLYFTLSASIRVLLEALTFVHILTLVQSYRQVSDSVQCSQIGSIPYIPVDNTYRMNIFIIFYLKICYNVTPILVFILQIFCLKFYRRSHNLHPSHSSLLTALIIFSTQHDL